VKVFGVYGVSGFGREVMPLARQALSAQLESHELVFVDDSSLVGSVNGHRVLTFEQFLASPASEKAICIAIADSSIRERLARKCRASNVPFFAIKSPSAIVLDENVIGEGAILCSFANITSNARIGSHFHANIYSYVAHDCIIGDFVTFAPSVKCNGNVHIEDYAYIGTGAILKQGKPNEPLVIGRGAIVGMGSVVTRSVPPGVTVVGNPAREMVK
jgi:sugar O-acyltransferase (sialic acid O-acetyltransferase NeuD family)